jgi:hypothetical protein
MDWRAIDAASLCGHLHILQWAHAQPGAQPPREQTYVNAAESGFLDVLQWLFAQQVGCFFWVVVGFVFS